MGGENKRGTMKKDANRVSNLQHDLFFDEIEREDPKSKPANAVSRETNREKEKMTRDEKYMLRAIFQNKIYKADGQKFEDLFTDIIKYAEPGFQQIKPYGNVGDKKNDGYIKSKGIYFQVYGP